MQARPFSARRYLQLVIALIGMVLGVWMMWRARHPAPDPPEVRAQRLQVAQGIVVGFGHPSSFFAAPYTAADAGLFDVVAEQAEPSVLPASLDGLEIALAKYPRGFVSSLVRAVFVCGELRVGGARSGGTVGPAWIILAAPKRLGDEGVFATSTIGLHHELSSFVLRKHPATAPRWSEFAPPTWSFVDEPNAVIARGEEAPPDVATGFLSAYGSTNLENDFNVYAEKAFTEPSRVIIAANDHPLVRQKLDFLMATYTTIDPRMDKVFRDLGLK